MFVNKEAVGKRILQIRKKYGYSMQKFGEIIDNAPKGSVNSWEKGVNLPNEKRLKQIATLGNMTLNELLYVKAFGCLVVDQKVMAVFLVVRTRRHNLHRFLFAGFLIHQILQSADADEYVFFHPFLVFLSLFCMSFLIPL